jgi:hypothetical protein
VTLDNIALVPASMLPERARYQAIANRLVAFVGAVGLIVA